MKASFISTSTLLNSTRSDMARIQSDLNKANIEADKERYADVGLELGYRTGSALDFRQQLDDTVALKQRNDLISTRLSTSQSALDQIRSDGESFLALVAPGKLSDDSGKVVAQAATAKLSAFIGQMNTSSAGQFVFSGINSETRPLADYETSPASAAKSAFAQAFQTTFGFAPGTQPDASKITAAQMQSFLDGPVARLFADPLWRTNWSSASDVNQTNQIGPGEIATTSTSANAKAFRQLAMIYTVGSDIGLSSLSSAAQNIVYDKLRSGSSQASYDLTGIQADLGSVEARVKTLGTQLEARKIVLTEGFGDLENVDQTEAGMRISKLQTQLSISYSLTSQMRKLSLMEYI